MCPYGRVHDSGFAIISSRWARSVGHMPLILVLAQISRRLLLTLAPVVTSAYGP